MDWDDLRYVLAVSREHTLSRAAANLGVTHTTVGRRLRAIEERLGVRLFDRTPDGFLPTPAGQDLSEAAERVEGEVLSVEGRVLGRDAQLQGKLRVSTLDFLFIGFHDAFASFMARYPSVDLTVTTTTSEVSLTRREADVVLRLSNSPTEYLVGRKVGRMAFAVYGSSALVERLGPDAGYGAYPWLNWDERTDTAWLDGWLAKNAPGAQIVMRMDGSALVLRKLLAEGTGVHFYPCIDGDADPALRRVGPIHPEFSRDLWLLTLPELRGTSRIRAFMDHMAEALCAHREALEGAPVSPEADTR